MCHFLIKLSKKPINPLDPKTRPGDVLHFRKRCSRARSNCRLWKASEGFTVETRSYFRKIHVENGMKWLFPKIYSDTTSFQMRFVSGVSMVILWCLTTTTTRPILSGSFDSWHPSSTLAVHEGKAILHSQLSHEQLCDFLASELIFRSPTLMFCIQQQMSINVDRYELHDCGLLVYEKRKWSLCWSSNDNTHMPPSSRPTLQSYQLQIGLRDYFILIVKVA